MLVVVSPAKKLNMSPIKNIKETKPFFAENVNELISEVRNLSSDNLKDLMGISSQLAELNKKRFMDFGKQDKKAAAFAFAGDTYKGLDIEKMDQNDLEWAQDHLRILSGLYGILRPYDKIQPYRLEMGTKINNILGESLYDFWKEKITNKINAEIKQSKSKFLFNLASEEYYSALDFGKVGCELINFDFKKFKNGKLSGIGMTVKKLRGRMANYIISNKINSLKKLEEFNELGFKYSSFDKTSHKFLFISKWTRKL